MPTPSVVFITKPEDRCPYPVGTKVAYWHWRESRISHLYVEPLGTPSLVFYGIVDTIQNDSAHPNLLGLPNAQPGELVIRYLDSAGQPTSTYDRVLLPPVGNDEYQRWFTLESDSHSSAS